MRKSALLWFGLVVAALVSLGLIVLSSAGEANGMRLHGDAYYFIVRQFLYLGVGIVVAIVVALFDYRNWRDHSWMVWLFLAVVIGLLVATLFFPPINGSRRWIPLGVIRLQPSELAKLIVVLLLAVWLDRAGWRVELLVRGAIMPAFLIVLIAVPILLEPDFGSVMVVGAVGLLLMFVAGVRKRYLSLAALLGVAAVAYKVCTNANRMARIAAFLGIKIDIGAEVLDSATERAAYQANQALIALGNSDIWGVGLGNSMQKQLYLPEAHTDFVFAIGAEELGICFSVGVVILFAAFFALSVYIAKHSCDRFGKFLVIGMAFIIYFQAMFNIGVVCEAFPTKGMALPFFSYGGTNMLSAFFAVGTILSVGIHSYREKKHTLGRKVLMRVKRHA